MGKFKIFLASFLTAYFGFSQTYGRVMERVYFYEIIESVPDSAAIDDTIGQVHIPDRSIKIIGTNEIQTAEDIKDLLAQDPDFSVNRFGIQVRGSPGMAYYVDGFRVLDPNLIDFDAVQSMNITAADIGRSYGDAVSGLADVRTIIGKTGGRFIYQTDDPPGRGDFSTGDDRFTANLGFGRTGRGLQGNVSGRLRTTNSYQSAQYPLPSPGLEDNARGRLRWVFPDGVSNINIMVLRGRTQFMVWNPYDDVGNNWKYAEHGPMRLSKNLGFGASIDWQVRTNMLASLRAGRFAYEIFDGNRDFQWENENSHSWFDDYQLKGEHLIQYLRNESLPYHQVLFDSVDQYHRQSENYTPEALRKNPYGASYIFFTVGDYPLWAYRCLENTQINADYSWFPSRNWSLKIGGGYSGYAGLFLLNLNPGYPGSGGYDKTDPEAVISGYVQSNISFGLLDIEIGLGLDHHRDFEWVWDSTEFPFHYIKSYYTQLDMSPNSKLTLQCAKNMEVFFSAGIRHHARPYYPMDIQPAKVVDWNMGYRAYWLSKIWFEFNPYYRTMTDFIVNTTSLAAYYHNYYEPDYYPDNIANAKAYGIASRLIARVDNASFVFYCNLQKAESDAVVRYYYPYDPYFPNGDSIWIGSIAPLSYDRESAMSFDLAYEFPASSPIKPLRNFAWSLIISKQAGLRYTPRDLRGEALGDPNSAKMPDWTNVDMKLGKKIIAGPVRFSLFAIFTNLFNYRQVVNVYPTTGDPLDHGDPILPVGSFGLISITSRYYTPQGDFNHDGLMTQVECRDEYIRARTDLYDDPTHFNPGFGFRLGAGIEF